jgi:hypothetical protein
VDKTGEIVWQFNGVTGLSDTSVEGIVTAALMSPSSEDHIVAVHEEFFADFPLLITALIEEDISGQQHKTSLAKYLGVSNPVRSFYMPTVSQ